MIVSDEFQNALRSFPKVLSQVFSSACPDGGTSRGLQDLERLWEYLAPGRGRGSLQSPAARKDVKTKEGGKNGPRGPHSEAPRGRPFHYSSEISLAKTYAGYYGLANALKVPAILDEWALLAGLKSPELQEILGAKADSVPVWLDLGSGPGSVLLGMRWYWGELASRWQWVAADQSEVFLSVLRGLWDRWGSEEVQRETRASPKLNTIHLDLTAVDPGPEDQDGSRRQGGRREREDPLFRLLDRWRPQVVSLSNVVSEVPSSGVLERCRRWAELRQVSCVFIVVEPGTEAAGRELLQQRAQWLESSKNGGSPWRVWLPCLDDRSCGALAAGPGEWCHEALAYEPPEWHRNWGAQVELLQKQMLFTYLVMSSLPEERTRASDQGGQGDTAGADSSVRGLEQLHKSWPLGGARVVSQRMVDKAMTRCFICTAEGRKQARVIHSRTETANELWHEVERGQCFQKVQLTDKGDVVAIEALPK